MLGGERKRRRRAVLRRVVYEGGEDRAEKLERPPLEEWRGVGVDCEGVSEAERWSPCGG